VAHVGMDFFLNRDVTAVKKYANALNVLLELWGDDFPLVCLKHSVTGKHFDQAIAIMSKTQISTLISLYLSFY
jgi:hypothetical protein